MGNSGHGDLVKRDQFDGYKIFTMRWVENPTSDGHTPSAASSLRRLTYMVGIAKDFVYMAVDASNALRASRPRRCSARRRTPARATRTFCTPCVKSLWQEILQRCIWRLRGD